jgi:S-(hydroxymethyl)glutathione dehydrogenase/alcohol dehydrogenase
MTGGGADYCFECTGSTSVMAEAFKSSRMVGSTAVGTVMLDATEV